MAAMTVSELACHMLDPRGRCNRKGLLIVAGLLLAAEIVVGLALWLAGVDLEGGGVLAIKAVCVWLAVCAGSKRLHDLNLSAWWMLGMLAISILATFALVVAMMVVLGPEALQPGTAWYFAALAGSMMPILAATLWLHFRKGQPGVNRFGAEPRGIGFAGPVISLQPAIEIIGRLQRLMVPAAA